MLRALRAATRLASRPQIDGNALTQLAAQLLAPAPLSEGAAVRELDATGEGSEPWLLDGSAQRALLRRLEDRFPPLEEAGCKVGIGVATGADKAYIGPFDQLDVEDDRKLPLVMTRDITDGTIQWRGYGVVNPFTDDGRLVDLAAYPRLQRYFEARRSEIAGRHCAKKTPGGWYRTIDRITPSLVTTPKLLVPDIKGQAHVAHDGGRFYPHHNLYFITSNEWDLRALQAVLLSRVARMFVAAYSTRMRGGFLRFQAQYLRRIRLPRWSEVPRPLRQALIEAACHGDSAACDRAAFALYGLTKQEEIALEGNSESQDRH